MVSASYLSNTLGGGQLVADFGNPGIITAKAQVNLSGGDLVQIFSGTAGLVGSGASSFVSEDLIVQPASDVKAFNGIVLQNAGSNTLCSVVTKGLHLMRAGGVVSGGYLVGHNASGGIANLQQTDGSGTALVIDNITVGKAWTSSASGTNLYALVELK
jgi:hypothetical protein